jgi:hypothetical protein
MRQLITRDTIRPLLDAIGERSTGAGSVYLVGGATAVWFGWRQTTIDIDLALAPEPAGLFSAIEPLKQEMQISIELASPGQFVPPLAGWQGRSEFITRVGLVDFYHYDFYSQAFAKLSRWHERDMVDVEAMFNAEKIIPSRLLLLVDEVMSQAKRYPNLDPITLREKVAKWVSTHAG